MTDDRSGRWMVMRADRGRGWGGEIRRARIFERLAERTSATVVPDWPTFQRVVRGRRWQRWLPRRGPAPHLVASETAPAKWVERIRSLGDPVAVAIYDDPVAQSRALGMPLPEDREAELTARRRENEDAFRWHVVPTASFAELVGLDPARVIVGGNGTVAAHVRPGPWPRVPTVGFVSGAAPGRGIETLVEAMRAVRSRIPEAVLRLWLLATSEPGEAYIAELRAATARDPWVRIAPAPYDELGERLAEATVLAIPHPPNAYMDVALPVKLFDSLAAGRPVVVTPRTETAAIVRANDVGVVTGGDDAESIASTLLGPLEDEALARRLGAAARELAERVYDWPIVGDRIADEILRRETS